MRLAAVIRNQGIYEGKPQDSVRGYDGSYSGYLSGQGKNSTTVAATAHISLPPPAFPPKFNELPPGQRQDYLDFRKQVSPLGLAWGSDFVRGQ
jgi:hypothetical protein